MYDMTQKMKGGFHSIRRKQISLVLIVLVCITILIWGCQRTSLLFPFLLQVDQVSRVSEDVLIDGSEPRPVLPTYSIQVSDGEEIELDKTNNSDEQDQQNHLEETSLVTEEISANDIEIGHKPRLALEEDNMASGDTFSYNNKTEDGQHVTSEEGKKDEVDQNRVNTNSTSDLETALPSQVSNKSIVTPNEKQDNMASGYTFFYNNKTEDGQPVTSEEGNKDEVDQNLVNTNSTSDLETALTSQVSNKSIVTPNEKQDDMASGDTFSYNNKTEDGQPVTSEEGNKDEVDQNRVNTNSTSDLETALPSQVSNKSIVTPNEKQVCNYGKGKWVSDESRPLYSGFKCKRWLSPMWACRLTQRKDFAYEKLRWKPKDCDVEDFQGDKFLERMRNKTLAFVGDSLGRQQFQSIMCMITGGKDRLDVRDIGNQFGLVKARGSVRPDGWAYLFPSTNTTILYYWSASLCDLTPIDPSNPKTKVAMHLDRPPAFLQHFLHRIDVLVLNTGHHWNRGKLNANRWVMYVGGKPNTNKRIAMIAVAKNFTIHSIVQWVDSQLPKYPGLKAFFRTISPRHFFNGDWNTGGSCDNTSPVSEGKEILQDKSSDSIASSAVMGKRVKLLDITAVSQLRDEGHISRYSIKATPGVQDCLHWCLPGVPDAWNEILNALI